MVVYSASKFALEDASESLYYEVRPWNIKVTLIEPGFIHSSSFQKVHYTSLGAHAERDPEDLFKGELIMLLMPAWVPFPRLASIVCGVWLVFWGSFILLGLHLR